MKPELSLITPRPEVELHKRKPLSKTKALILACRQRGICGCGCGNPLDPAGEKIIDEHVLALILGGTNDLDNRALWRKPCADAKTRGDRAKRDKTRRQRRELKRQNAPKKQIPSPGFRQGAKTSWPSRPFPTRRVS